MPRALITGITGQDGRYLAELLIGKGYQVHGMVRGQANPKAKVVQDEVPEVELIDGDLTDLSSLSQPSNRCSRTRCTTWAPLVS